MAKQLSLGALLRCGPVRRFQPIAVLHPPAQRDARADYEDEGQPHAWMAKRMGDR